MTQPRIDIKELLNILEIDIDSVELFKVRDFNAGKQALKELKRIAKSKRKQLAKKYHPDICDDENKMKEINNAVDIILKIQLQRPRPQPIIIRYSMSPYYTSTASTYTTSTASRNYY